MQEKKATPLRSDAQRNRERILEVALAELTRSADTPLSAIAKKAGVGQGTFYRNFPNREALLLEIYRHEVQQVADTAAQLLETRAPDRALREWMDRLAQFAMTKVGLAEALRATTLAHGTLTRLGHGAMSSAAALLLTANDEAGTIRPGVTPRTSSSSSPVSGRSTRAGTGSRAPPAFWTSSWTAYGWARRLPHCGSEPSRGRRAAVSGAPSGRASRPMRTSRPARRLERARRSRPPVTPPWRTARVVVFRDRDRCRRRKCPGPLDDTRRGGRRDSNPRFSLDRRSSRNLRT